MSKSNYQIAKKFEEKRNRVSQMTTQRKQSTKSKMWEILQNNGPNFFNHTCHKNKWKEKRLKT